MSLVSVVTDGDPKLRAVTRADQIKWHRERAASGLLDGAVSSSICRTTHCEQCASSMARNGAEPTSAARSPASLATHNWRRNKMPILKADDMPAPKRVPIKTIVAPQ
jgi:hypothetical protein